MPSWILYALAAVGSFTAGTVLAAPSVDTYPLDTGFSFGAVETSGITASATGALVAASIALWLRHRVGALGAVVAGAALVAVVALPGAWRFDMYVSAVGAGLVLGALVVCCARTAGTRLPAVMTGGVVAALLTAEPVAEYREFAASSSGSAVYLEVSAQPANTVWTVLSVTVIAVATAALVMRAGAPDSVDERRWDVRETVVGIGLPLVAVVLYRSLHSAVWSPDASPGGNGRWLWGIVAVPLVIGAALWLRERSGAVLLAAFAVAVAAGTAPSWIPGGWLLPAVMVVLAAVGAWLGRRAPRPTAGVGVLAFVTITAIFTRAPWDNVHLLATFFVLPVAAAYTISAALPSTSAVTAASFSLPAVMALPLLTRFGWTAYTPLTDSPSGWTPDSWTVLTTGVSVAGVLAAGAAMWWIGRRSEVL
ncbi:hypothetical protein ACWEQD_07180 [Rhodococcus pyridinivorans]